MIKIFKKVGQTPLEVINELRQANPGLVDQKLSYAGRLDPMAEGQMVIMVGDKENQNREKFLNTDKLYEADILVGFSTDSYDALGLVNDDIRIENLNSIKITYKDLEIALKKIKKIKKISYPDFSSKTVEGKPLWKWKKEGIINQIEIPTRKIKIKKIKILDNQSISGFDLFNYLEFVITKINGDFRQSDIIKVWKDKIINNQSYQVIKVSLKVSSGTYIRSLVHELSKEIGIPCCLLKLNRKKIYFKKTCWLSQWLLKFHK